MEDPVIITPAAVTVAAQIKGPMGRKGLMVPGQCQYFVLSPRPSLESPTKASEIADENADQNVGRQRSAVKGPVKKMAAPGSAKKVPASARTPGPASGKVEARESTPIKNRSSAEAATPATQRSVRSVPNRSVPVTPVRPDSACAEDMDDLNTSVYSASMYSEVSAVSRLTQLSRKTITRKHLSSKEMEDLKIEEKRRQIGDLIRRNQINCRK
ncbi:unnamed protein product, partial [Polarella glacialis]